MTCELRRLLVLASSAVAITVGNASPAVAHRDGCHAHHSCPSDTGSYVCGDTGNYSECPAMGGSAYISASTPAYGTALNGSVTWTAQPTSVTYQWTRGGQPIPGATTSSYTVAADDLGQTLVLVASGKDGRDQTATASSPPVNVPPLAGQATLVQAAATVGTILSAQTTWNAPVSEAYQWVRGGLPIAGATAATYLVTKEDLGQPIIAAVSGSAGSSRAMTQTGPLTPTAAVKLTLTGPKARVSAGRAVAIAGVARSPAPVAGLKISIKVSRRVRATWKTVSTRTVTIGPDGTFGLRAHAGRRQAGKWKARADLASPAGYQDASASRSFRVH